MSNDTKFRLSRRKTLAALGTVGAASAGAGLGTSAFFSDEETFEGNTLTAGELDIKVGWESHYSDWSDDETAGLDGEVRMEGGADISDSTRVGLPSNVASMISLDDAADAKRVLDNTQVTQYPDGYDSDDYPTGSTVPCSDLSGEALADGDTERVVFELDDVKPGDFGEVTFSFALCDNPGYVWAQAFLDSASENGVTEPEAKDDDEEESEPRPASGDSGGDTVELLDEVMVGVWPDDGNNYQNCGEQPLTVGTLREVIEGIPNPGLRLDGRNVQASDISPTDFTAYGVNRFDIDGDGTYDADVKLDDDPVDSGEVAHATSGGTETADYVTTAVCLDERPTLAELTSDSTLTYQYYGGPQNASSAPDEVYLLIEEGPNGSDPGTEHVVYRASNDGSPADETWKTRNVHNEISGNPDNNPGFNWFELTDSGRTNLGGGGPTSDLSTVYGDDAVVNAMAAGRGTTGGGDVLDAYYREPMLNGESVGNFPTSCFRGDGTVHNGVFAWWLPVDHANEIQTDSATFSLGLYTEQCRHNDGSGMSESGNGDGGATGVSITGSPSDDDADNSLEGLDLNFEFDVSGATVDSVTYAGQPLGTSSVSFSNGGQTVELRSLGGPSMSTDESVTVELSGVSTGTGTTTVGLVFEPDSDSSEDDTAQITT